MYAFGDVVDDIPAYGYARPCRRVKVRFAIREHHEACTNENRYIYKRQQPRTARNLRLRMGWQWGRMGEKTKRNTTHIEIQGHAEDRQQPQNTIEPTDTPMEPILRPCCQHKCALPIPFLFPARQRMQEKVKDIDRQKGDAVEQERLERIRADLGIAAYTQSTNRRAKKKVERQTFLVMSPTTMSHRKASTRPRHAQPICNLRVSWKARKTG